MNGLLLLASRSMLLQLMPLRSSLPLTFEYCVPQWLHIQIWDRFLEFFFLLLGFIGYWRWAFGVPRNW